MSESFAELFEESVANLNLKPGTMVMGTVVDLSDDFVVVNAGLKSEGVIPKEQFLNADGDLEVAVGDQVEVALDAVEDGFGATRLSREKAKRHHAWIELQKAYDDEEIVNGRITGKVKGGFTVDLGQVRGFLPGSLVDVRPVRDTSYLEGKELEFKVIKLDQRRNNVVVSRRAVVEQEYSEEDDGRSGDEQEGRCEDAVAAFAVHAGDIAHVRRFESEGEHAEKESDPGIHHGDDAVVTLREKLRVERNEQEGYETSDDITHAVNGGVAGQFFQLLFHVLGR